MTKKRSVDQKTIPGPKWQLKLYVAGAAGKSAAALRNLKSLCDQHLLDEYEIQIIDLLVHPHLAKGDQIIAIPTLIKKMPAPVRKIIGDLSNTEKVIVGLDIRRLK